MKPYLIEYRSHGRFYKDWSCTKKEWKRWKKGMKDRRVILFDKMEIIHPHFISRRSSKQKFFRELLNE